MLIKFAGAFGAPRDIKFVFWYLLIGMVYGAKFGCGLVVLTYGGYVYLNYINVFLFTKSLSSVFNLNFVKWLEALVTVVFEDVLSPFILVTESI